MPDIVYEIKDRIVDFFQDLRYRIEDGEMLAPILSGVAILLTVIAFIVSSGSAKSASTLENKAQNYREGQAELNATLGKVKPIAMSQEADDAMGQTDIILQYPSLAATSDDEGISDMETKLGITSSQDQQESADFDETVQEEITDYAGNYGGALIKLGANSATDIKLAIYDSTTAMNDPADADVSNVRYQDMTRTIKAAKYGESDITNTLKFLSGLDISSLKNVNVGDKMYMVLGASQGSHDYTKYVCTNTDTGLITYGNSSSDDEESDNADSEDTSFDDEDASEEDSSDTTDSSSDDSSDMSSDISSSDSSDSSSSDFSTSDGETTTTTTTKKTTTTTTTTTKPVKRGEVDAVIVSEGSSNTSDAIITPDSSKSANAKTVNSGSSSSSSSSAVKSSSADAIIIPDTSAELALVPFTGTDVNDESPDEDASYVSPLHISNSEGETLTDNKTADLILYQINTDSNMVTITYWNVDGSDEAVAALKAYKERKASYTQGTTVDDEEADEASTEETADSASLEDTTEYASDSAIDSEDTESSDAADTSYSEKTIDSADSGDAADSADAADTASEKTSSVGSAKSTKKSADDYVTTNDSKAAGLLYEN